MQNQKIEMIYDDGVNPSTTGAREKVPHYIEVKIVPKMDDNTKEWCEKFNIMRNRLIEIGEMESK